MKCNYNRPHHSRPKLQLVDRNGPEAPCPAPKVALTPQSDRDSMADAFLSGKSMGELFYTNRSFGFGLLDIQACVRESLTRRLGIQERNRRVVEFVRRAA